MNTNQIIQNSKMARWIDLFKDQRASGKTVKEWCAENGISHDAYYYWKRKVKESYVDSVIPDIVPLPIVQVSEDPEDTCATCTTCATLPSLSHNLANLCDSPKSDPISVSIGDIKISIGSSATDELIAKIIGAVRHA